MKENRVLILSTNISESIRADHSVDMRRSYLQKNLYLENNIK